MYVPRLLEAKLLRLAKNFKTVLVVGARQVGKSTLLAHCFPTYKHITFDAVSDDYGAKQDPARFLDNFPPPIILDEIQYCQQLLPPLKRYVDNINEKGQYLLTSSQNLSASKNAAESMAGRVGIMQLDTLTFEEIAQTPQHFLSTYLQNPESLTQYFSGLLPLNHTLYEMIFRGGMPDILTLQTEEVADYFSSYLTTYIERDVRLLENIQNITSFDRFVRLTSALCAQEINYSQLGRELDISRLTANKWLDILKHTYQWYDIPPYHGKTIKRITKKYKGYMHDTGMACFLQRLSSPEALASHPMLGAFFENFVVMNIVKLANTLSTPPYLYHWRSNAGAEVDLILERDGKLFPIEIKCKSQLSKHDMRGIRSFKETYPSQPIQTGIIIYTGNQCFELADDVIAVPWNAVFKEE